MPNIKEMIENRKLQNELDKAIETISTVGIRTDMDSIFDYETFKIKAEGEISKKPQGTLFMGDMDGLCHANNIYSGSNKVDQIIKNIIGKIKKELREHKIIEYDIGKLGDEIYIYTPLEIGEEKTEQLTSKLNEIEDTGIGISFGGTTQIEFGIKNAIEIAEKQMKENKRAKLEEKIKNDQDEKKTIKEWMEYLDEKLRINTNKMTSIQVMEYENIKKEAILKIIKEIEEGIETEETDEKTEEDKQKLIEEMERMKDEYRKKYSIPIKEDDLEILIIAKKLLQTPIKEIEKQTAFLTEKYKMFKGANKKQTIQNLENTKLITIDIGKIKFVNDKYSHTKCDEYVNKIMQEVVNLIKEEKIQMKGEKLFSRKISEYQILIDGKTSEAKINVFKKRLEEIEKKYPLTINCSKARSLIEKSEEYRYIKNYPNDQQKELIIDAYYNTIRKNEKDIEQIGLDKKRKDKELIYATIRKESFFIKKYAKKLKELLGIDIKKGKKEKNDIKNEKEPEK